MYLIYHYNWHTTALDPIGQSVSQWMSVEVREGVKKKSTFLGKSPKLWVGGGQDS